MSLLYQVIILKREERGFTTEAKERMRGTEGRFFLPSVPPSPSSLAS
jgi:hypothetical protein